MAKFNLPLPRLAKCMSLSVIIIKTKHEKILLSFLLLVSISVTANLVRVPLQTRGIETTGMGSPLPRTPILAPTVYLDDHTLILYTEFEETIQVQLLDPDTMDDDEPTVVYSINVPAGTQQVALPDTYTGEYGIRLVVGQWYFIGEITL